MAENDDVVTTQPRANRKEVEEFVRDVDPIEVLEWNEDAVIENYLKPIGMEFMAKEFKESKITGPVLMALTEKHMKEMGCCVLGDRIQFMNYLELLKKHKRDADRSKALWTGTTPVLNLRYHRNMGEFCFHLCCPCCIATTEWRITGQGLRWRRNRAAVNCCGDVQTQFIDYRFFKDLEIRKEPRCCCCFNGHELLIYADDKDSVSPRQARSAVSQGPDAELEPVSIMHPEAPWAESLMRNAWADVQLVAD